MPEESTEQRELVVPLKRAQAGFPSVCAMTGGAADGAISLPVGRSRTRWRSPVVRIPLSKPMFVRWSRRQNIHVKARGLAITLAAIGVVIAFRNATLAIGVLAVAIAVHLLDLWAERGAAASRPILERDGANVRIRGVHDDFIDAVNSTAE